MYGLLGLKVSLGGNSLLSQLAGLNLFFFPFILSNIETI